MNFKNYLSKLDEKTKKEVEEVQKMIEKDGGKLLLSAMGHSNIPEVFKIDNNCGQLIF